MKKLFIIVLFLFITLNASSQENKGNEITTEGVAKKKVKPDLARIRITIEKHNIIEKNSIKELNEEIAKLQKLLQKIGFTEMNIKISEYKVSSNLDNNDKKEYTALNTLVVEFNLNNRLIESFYQEIQNESIKDADVEFETQISEELEKNTRQKLMLVAIEEARQNAQNIANALDVKLLNVKQASKFLMRNYDSASMIKVDQVKFASPAKQEINERTSFSKFEVEEKELEETITLIYEISKK
jgi:uncharacterized protein